jgi:hypothetical protein
VLSEVERVCWSYLATEESVELIPHTRGMECVGDEG